MTKGTGFGTLAIHAGQAPDPTTGAIMHPVYQTSTFVQSSPGIFKGEYDYARSANPTRTALEANLAALEGGKYGLSFSSGCATIDAVLHLLTSGDHVVLGDDVYGGTFRMFDKVFKQLGISYTMVDMTDLNKVKAAFTLNTKLVWMETPTNPLLKIFNIKEVAKISKSHGSILVVDNTFATPYLQNPLNLGADIVSHSVTKYIGGHSDLIGGALIVNDSELAIRLRYIQNAVGAVPSPWDCFLLLRSTKTLHVRMEKHCSNAMEVAKFLESSNRVERVYYPGLVSHPQHDLAKKQMRNFSGIVTFILKGDITDARKFLESLKIFSLAESLGGVESLVDHPVIMTHASIPKAQRDALGITEGLIRLSVGIEDIQDLIADLRQALNVT